MIKLVCAGAIPRSLPRADLFCHANLDTLEDSLSPEEFSAIVTDVRIGGVFKRTNPGRLPQTDEALCGLLAGNQRADYRVLDLGASDGSTTVDLAVALRARLPGTVKVYLTDRFLWLRRYRRGPWAEYRAADGQPVMVRCGRLALRLPTSEHSWDVLSNVLLARPWLACRGFRQRMTLEAELPLVQPAALTTPGIELREVDCFALDPELVGHIDGVRAANLLNHCYFTREQLAQAVACCHAYLRPGGALVVMRSVGPLDREVEHGSTWRRADDRFEPVGRFGQGSEIQAVVDTWRATPG